MYFTYKSLEIQNREQPNEYASLTGLANIKSVYDIK